MHANNSVLVGHLNRACVDLSSKIIRRQGSLFYEVSPINKRMANYNE